ncbi:hypothetical protein P0F65_10665 [Sphingomonas sp. I4]
MADDFEVFEDGRGSVLVMLHPDAAISRDEIIKLLVQAGADPDAITFVEPNDVDEADAKGQCVVIPIDRNVADAPNSSRPPAAARSRRPGWSSYLEQDSSIRICIRLRQVTGHSAVGRRLSCSRA